MKGLLKIYRRYLVTAVVVILVFLFLNILVLLAVTGHTLAVGNQERYPVMSFRMTAEEMIQKNGTGFYLSEKGKEYLERNHSAFLMLLDEDSGSILYSWNLPPDMDRAYDLSDVASFSRWYLEDYPVKCWDTGYGLLVVASEKGAEIKYSYSYRAEDFKSMLHTIPVILWVDGAAVLVILFIMSRKFHRSLLPISYGIQQLCEGTAVDIHTKGVVKDLGDQLNQISRILERQRRDIARRDAARTEWIAGVSHDIRTPLSMILGYAENLTESENLSPEERRQAGVIRDESIRIRRLIEDLNLTSKLAYDMQPLRLKKYRPAVLLRRIVTGFLNKEYGDAFGFSLEIQKEVEQMELTGDVQLLERALGNLIHNSIRHNPQGCAVFVSCRKEKNGIAVSLRDTGKGIPRTVRLCVLNGEQPPKDVHIMGLRIVKQIIAAHKGSLSISEDGREVGLYLPEDFGTNL